MSRIIKVNFTQSDIDALQYEINSKSEENSEVFNWNISNCDVSITVGPDA